MRITFFGAAGEVTGSSTLVESGPTRVLVDLGLIQGGRLDRARNHEPLPFDASSLDAVVLTHAHIDHSGRLPLLTRAGFRGQVFATGPSVELAGILLRDSAHVQAMDAQRQSLRRQRRGLPPVTPLYDADDVERFLPCLRSVSYGQRVALTGGRAGKGAAGGLWARWLDAGHILGSASVELGVDAPPGRPAPRLLFSGDLGPRSAPLMRDPAADDATPHAVILESTYGDRDHRSPEATAAEFDALVKEAVWNKERLLVPAFAVGRTQAVLYHLARLMHTGRVPQFPVYLDSPMAIETLELYRRHAALLDDEARALAADGRDPLRLPTLRVARTRQESQAINDLPGPLVVIAASGMCTGGRILHHLKHNLWRRDARVIIAGYQSAGSLGRRLVDGARLVRVLGQPVAVRARVHTLGGLSAHAGQSELVDWAVAVRPPGPGATRPRFFLNHGEEAPRAALAQRLTRELGPGVRVERPGLGDSFEIDPA